MIILCACRLESDSAKIIRNLRKQSQSSQTSASTASSGYHSHLCQQNHKTHIYIQHISVFLSLRFFPPDRWFACGHYSLWLTSFSEFQWKSRPALITPHNGSKLSIFLRSSVFLLLLSALSAMPYHVRLNVAWQMAISESIRLSFLFSLHSIHQSNDLINMH